MGDRGGLVLDKDFDMSLQSSQRWLARFCSRLAKQPFYHDPLIGASSLLGRIPLALSNCFIENFREWMERPCRDTLTGEDHTPCCEASEFPFEPKIFDRLIPIHFNRLKILVLKRFYWKKIVRLALYFYSKVVLLKIGVFLFLAGVWGWRSVTSTPPPLTFGGLVWLDPSSTSPPPPAQEGVTAWKPSSSSSSPTSPSPSDTQT